VSGGAALAFIYFFPKLTYLRSPSPTGWLASPFLYSSWLYLAFWVNVRQMVPLSHSFMHFKRPLRLEELADQVISDRTDLMAEKCKKQWYLFAPASACRR